MRTVGSEIGFRPNTLSLKNLSRFLTLALPIALPNSVKRIQGCKSQVAAGVYCLLWYRNLLLCGIGRSRWPYLEDFA
jgi:hypothetical protein